MLCLDDHCAVSGTSTARGSRICPLAAASQKDVYYEPLKSPLEDQLAEPAVSALLRRFADDLPLSLCRYAVRLPDGGVVLALAEPTQVSRGRLLRFDRKWRWDHSFLARFEWGHPAITMQLALDGWGGLLVIGALKSLNGREFTGRGQFKDASAATAAARLYRVLSLR